MKRRAFLLGSAASAAAMATAGTLLPSTRLPAVATPQPFALRVHDIEREEFKRVMSLDVAADGSTYCAWFDDDGNFECEEYIPAGGNIERDDPRPGPGELV